MSLYLFSFFFLIKRWIFNERNVVLARKRKRDMNNVYFHWLNSNEKIIQHRRMTKVRNKMKVLSVNPVKDIYGHRS